MRERDIAALLEMANKVPVLKDALRQAIDELQGWVDNGDASKRTLDASQRRIDELRKFLA